MNPRDKSCEFSSLKIGHIYFFLGPATLHAGPHMAGSRDEGIGKAVLRFPGLGEGWETRLAQINGLVGGLGPRGRR
jgi:hypothetical protein